MAAKMPEAVQVAQDCRDLSVSYVAIRTLRQTAYVSGWLKLLKWSTMSQPTSLLWQALVMTC